MLRIIRERFACALDDAAQLASNHLPWTKYGNPPAPFFWLMGAADFVQGEGPGPYARLSPEELAEQERWRSMTVEERVAEWNAEIEAEGGVF